MKKISLLLCSVLLALALAACNNVDDATAETYIAKAEEVVKFLNEGEFEQITAQFDAQMAAQLSAEQLTQITPVLDASGEIEKYEKQSVQEKDGNKTVVLVAKHSKEKRIYTVTYNSNDEIVGLFVQ